MIPAARPFLLSITLFLACSTLSAQTKRDSAYILRHQFDFWIGMWNVYKSGTDTLAGHSIIESILDSFAIRESYKAARNRYTGTSLNKYNPQSKMWEQYWVDNSGLTLFLRGGFRDDKMIMEGETKLPGNKVQQEKITWYKNKDGTVRQVWEQRLKGGTEWKTAFDGLYKKRVE